MALFRRKRSFFGGARAARPSPRVRVEVYGALSGSVDVMDVVVGVFGACFVGLSSRVNKMSHGASIALKASCAATRNSVSA